MGKKNANPNLTHAKHNEQACDFIFNEDKFHDWTVVTAFYSALHYVHHKIFPVSWEHNGRNHTARSLEEFITKTRIKDKKHRILGDLVYDYISLDAGDEYADLLTMSYVARYNNMPHDKSLAEKARKCLESIKRECV